jgi:hypothetical protein
MMTREQAIKRLVKTRQLDTRMLDSLGISFETFLQFSQLSKEATERAIDRMIKDFCRKEP